MRQQIDAMNGSIKGGGGGGFAQAILGAGFHPKLKPSVEIPLSSALGIKASTLPGVGDWNRAAPVVVPMGRDQRFLNSVLVSQSVQGETAVQDFKQTVRTVTGSVQRAP
jgi:hypothetical protein